VENSLTLILPMAAPGAQVLGQRAQHVAGRIFSLRPPRICSVRIGGRSGSPRCGQFLQRLPGAGEAQRLLDGCPTRPISSRLARLKAQPSASARAGAADAVGVGGRIGRDVDVDHRFQPSDVQPARRDVGGHQHADAAVGKLHQHLVAVALLQVAVQFQCGEALPRSTSTRSRHCCLVLQKASVLTGR
jgi:hypothetical protein